MAARDGHRGGPERGLREVDRRAPIQTVAGMRERSRRERRGLLTRTAVTASYFGACVRAKRAGQHTGSKTVEGTHTGLENKAPPAQRSRTWAAEGQCDNPSRSASVSVRDG